MCNVLDVAGQLWVTCPAGAVQARPYSPSEQEPSSSCIQDSPDMAQGLKCARWDSINEDMVPHRLSALSRQLDPTTHFITLILKGTSEVKKRKRNTGETGNNAKL